MSQLDTCVELTATPGEYCKFTSWRISHSRCPFHVYHFPESHTHFGPSPLRSLPTSVLAHFGPYHTHFGPKIWVRSGHGPKWVGTEVGIERRVDSKPKEHAVLDDQKKRRIASLRSYGVLVTTKHVVLRGITFDWWRLWYHSNITIKDTCWTVLCVVLSGDWDSLSNCKICCSPLLSGFHIAAILHYWYWLTNNLIVPS